MYLDNFRNYERERIYLSRGINVIYGENGQGKTNLLEAIYFALRGESFRVGRKSDLVREGDTVGTVHLEIEERGVRRSVARQVDLNGGTRSKLDGREIRYDAKNAIHFSSDDLMIIKGEPQKRRNFIDGVLREIDHGFLEEESKYRRALSQRNETLKRIRRGEAGMVELGVWENILVESGKVIVDKRRETIAELGERVSGYLKDYDGSRLEIKYYSTFRSREEYRSRLESFREREVVRGVTLIGPHRDELVFLLNGRNLKGKGSQGQQRVIGVLLKLSVGGILEKRLGEEAVYVLDDIFSDLDWSYSSWLMDILRGVGQAILTVSKNRIETLGGVDRCIEIKGGRVKGGS